MKKIFIVWDSRTDEEKMACFDEEQLKLEINCSTFELHGQQLQYEWVDDWKFGEYEEEKWQYRKYEFDLEEYQISILSIDFLESLCV